MDRPRPKTIVDETTFARLFDWCQQVGAELLIFLDENSARGPVSQPEEFRTHGVVLSIHWPEQGYENHPVPAAASIERAAAELCSRLRV